MADMARAGGIDVLTGEYLAEVTMLVLGKARAKDSTKGFAITFLQHLDAAREHLVANRIRLVVNAGGLHPAGLAAATRELIARHGHDLRVSHIEGDDVFGSLDGLGQAGHCLPHLTSGQPLSDWPHQPVQMVKEDAGDLGEMVDLLCCERVDEQAPHYLGMALGAASSKAVRPSGVSAAYMARDGPLWRSTRPRLHRRVSWWWRRLSPSPAQLIAELICTHGPARGFRQGDERRVIGVGCGSLEGNACAELGRHEASA
ncbi:hypothetical protein AQJ43_31185 [Streptomyces avermitilis]|nr:hypothetical protein AQJ43_31185 [Streptomyces avermitilis]